MACSYTGYWRTLSRDDFAVPAAHIYRLVVELISHGNSTFPRTRIRGPKFLRARAPIQINVERGRKTWKDNILSPLRELLDYLSRVLEPDFSGL